VERGHSKIVDKVHIYTTVEYILNNSRESVFESANESILWHGCTGRSRGKRVMHSRQEEGVEVGIPVKLGEIEGSAVVIVANVWIGKIVEEEGDGWNTAATSTIVKRGSSAFVLGVDIGIGVEKDLDNVGVAVKAGHVKRSAHEYVSGVDVGSFVKETADEVGRAPKGIGGFVKKGPSLRERERKVDTMIGDKGRDGRKVVRFGGTTDKTDHYDF